jgi:hypothetical protein
VLEGGGRSCEKCGNSTGDSSHRICRRCRHDNWLLLHADEIDRYLAAGFTFMISCDLVRIHSKVNKIKCLRCGELMNKVSNGQNFFCTKHTKCRQAHTKLKWLRFHHKKPLEIALKTVVDSLDMREGKAK